MCRVFCHQLFIAFCEDIRNIQTYNKETGTEQANTKLKWRTVVSSNTWTMRGKCRTVNKKIKAWACLLLNPILQYGSIVQLSKGQHLLFFIYICILLMLPCTKPLLSAYPSLWPFWNIRYWLLEQPANLHLSIQHNITYETDWKCNTLGLRTTLCIWILDF